jgi:hypothetical protein
MTPHKIALHAEGGWISAKVIRIRVRTRSGQLVGVPVKMGAGPDERPPDTTHLRIRGQDPDPPEQLVHHDDRVKTA